MPHMNVRRPSIIALALLLSLSFGPVCFSAEEGTAEEILIKVTALQGEAKVTKADGTTETLTDTSKSIQVPATIEMLGPRGSFSVALPTTFSGKYDTISWTQLQGEIVRVVLLAGNKGVRFEYLKGTQKLYLNVLNRQNLLAVASVQGTTALSVLQNRISIPAASSVALTIPMNIFASVLMLPGQITEIQFAYVPIEIPFVEELVIPVTEPETVEQSPFLP